MFIPLLSLSLSLPLFVVFPPFERNLDVVVPALLCATTKKDDYLLAFFPGNSGFIVGEKARNRVPFLPVLILSERSSPSRVRFPAPKKRRALDCCGPL